MCVLDQNWNHLHVDFINQWMASTYVSIHKIGGYSALNALCQILSTFKKCKDIS